MRTRLSLPYPYFPSCGKKRVSLNQSNGTVGFENFSGVEPAFLIEDGMVAALP